MLMHSGVSGVSGKFLKRLTRGTSLVGALITFTNTLLSPPRISNILSAITDVMILGGNKCKDTFTA